MPVICAWRKRNLDVGDTNCRRSERRRRTTETGRWPKLAVHFRAIGALSSAFARSRVLQTFDIRGSCAELIRRSWIRTKQRLKERGVVPYVTCVDVLWRGSDYLCDAGNVPLSNLVGNLALPDAIEIGYESIEIGITRHLIGQLLTHLVQGDTVRTLSRQTLLNCWPRETRGYVHPKWIDACHPAQFFFRHVGALRQCRKRDQGVETDRQYEQQRKVTHALCDRERRSGHDERARRPTARKSRSARGTLAFATLWIDVWCAAHPATGTRLRHSDISA